MFPFVCLRLRHPADRPRNVGRCHRSSLFPQEDAAGELPVQPPADRAPPGHLLGQPGQHSGGVLTRRFRALQQVK